MERSKEIDLPRLKISGLTYKLVSTIKRQQTFSLLNEKYFKKC